MRIFNAFLTVLRTASHVAKYPRHPADHGRTSQIQIFHTASSLGSATATLRARR